MGGFSRVSECEAITFLDHHTGTTHSCCVLRTSVSNSTYSYTTPSHCCMFESIQHPAQSGPAGWRKGRRAHSRGSLPSAGRCPHPLKTTPGCDSLEVSVNEPLLFHLSEGVDGAVS